VLDEDPDVSTRTTGEDADARRNRSPDTLLVIVPRTSVVAVSAFTPITLGFRPLQPSVWTANRAGR